MYRWRAKYLILFVLTMMFPIYLNVENILLSFNMDKEASRQAGLYIMSEVPGIFVMALLDIDRNFMASFENSSLSMICEGASPAIHIMFCYFFIIKFEMGVIGAGLAGFCTNSIGFTIQSYYMKKVIPDAKEALQVKWNDPRNFKEYGSYLAISIPSMLLIIFEYASQDF